MNANPGPYQERFPLGSVVRIASESDLKTFQATWKYHHPLQNEQLRFAGMTATVRDVGFYFGGDVLYMLEETGSFIWHEACLRELLAD